MRIAACAVAALVMLLATASGARTQTRAPNIVVIVADDMGYADIGVHGSKDIPTPNIDALAAGGIRFTDAYVSGPYCGPTRAGLMTGRYPQRFGHEFNIGLSMAHREAGLPLEERTMADYLNAAGYRTALIGKWHLGTAPRYSPLRRGFDEFFGFLGGAHSYTGVGPRSNPIYDGGEPATSISYLTDTLAARAVEFIERNKARPFFLYLAFNAVHAPLQAPEKYLARVSRIADERRRTYAAMLVAMDDGIGSTLAALRDNGLDETTLVFFFSDNGGPVALQGANGSSNGPLRGQKAHTFEGGIRVPFIIRWTGRLPAGATDSRPIIQLDVLPTALAAAGIAVKPEWRLDGVNLLPFLTAQASGAPHEALYWRLGGHMAIRKGDWKLVKSDAGGATDDPAKTTLEGTELFNLSTDIGEKSNLASAHPEKVRELSDEWLRWKDQLASPRWPPPQGYRGVRQSCLDPSLRRPLQSYAGTWQGSFGLAVTWTWVQGADSAGTITFMNDTTRYHTRVIFASADSLVADVIEPVAVRRPGTPAVSVQLVGYLCEDEMTGFVNTRSPDRGTTRAPLGAIREPR